MCFGMCFGMCRLPPTRLQTADCPSGMSAPLQPPPPPPDAGSSRAEGKRKCKTPAPRGPVSLSPYLNTGERVKANASVRLSKTNATLVRSMSLFPGKIGAVKESGAIFEMLFDDGTTEDVPADWIQREDFSSGRTWATVTAGMHGPDSRASKKKKKEPTPLHWQLDGFTSAFVRPGEADDSMLDRLVFRAQISYRVNGKYVQGELPELVSLRAMVESQKTAHEVNIHVNAMYEMMQILFHTTPTQAGRKEMLGNVDPFLHGHAEVAATRARIYSEHARLAALDDAAAADDSEEDEED
jgi:hypothetical protein